jgi:hypothetical protein
MNRLREQWRSAYSDARIALIWREVQHMSPQTWSGLVDRFLGEATHAPLIPAIREAMAKDREYQAEQDRVKNKRETETAMRALFDADIIGSICKTISDRIEGNVPDETFSSFRKGIQKLATVEQCGRCEDRGLHWLTGEGGNEYPYRCRCAAGMRQSPRIPLISIEGYRGIA